MSEIVIWTEKLGKRYRIGEKVRYHTLRESIRNAFLNGFRAASGKRAAAGTDTIWALRDISLAVPKGEVLGLIGANGAGKSTLLKILSKITRPTEGKGVVCGRVGSLLEVATGFHTELTGRENIYLNGAILGMKRREIERKFDEIVDFAEIAAFIDTPVKRYSTGMYMRLAFSVAAHLEPDILLVDEVLAVGDAAFQKKCLGKVGQAAQGGRTVLFVSHNMAAVQSLCSRVIWIDNGRIVDQGDPKPVVSRYLQSSFSSLTQQSWPDLETAPGNDQVRLRRIAVRPSGGRPGDPIDVHTPVELEFQYWNLRPNAHLNLSLHLFNEQGVMVLNAIPVDEPRWLGRPYPAGLFRDVCRIPGDLLNDGAHRVQLLVVRDEANVIYQHDDILSFDVLDAVDHGSRAWYGKIPGVVRPRLSWTTECLEELEPFVRLVY